MKKPAKKATKKPTKKPARKASVEQLGARIEKAEGSLKDTRRQVTALKKLLARYERQLKALAAGLKMLTAREKGFEKELAGLKKERESAKAARKAKGKKRG